MKVRLIVVALVLFAMAFLASCGGAGSVQQQPPPPASIVSFTASKTTITAGDTIQLSYSTQNTNGATPCTASANPAQTDWTGSVASNASGVTVTPNPGSGTSVVYTLGPCAGDGGSSGTKAVTVTVNSVTPPPITVTVNPGTAQATQGETVQFTATVTGATNTNVSWSVSSGLGTISAGGLYTAPASITIQSTATITATSQADNKTTGSGTVTLMPPTAGITVTVSPKTQTMTVGTTQQFTAAVSNTPNTQVTWSVDVGSISASGLYQAPQMISAMPTAATVTATSVADPTKFGTASVALNYARPVPSGSWQITAPSGGLVTVLAQDKANPAIVYADADDGNLGALYTSSDGGSTWEIMVTNSLLDWAAVSDLWANGNVIYAPLRGLDFMKSTDHGATWKQVAVVQSGGFIGSMNVDPTNAATIYLSVPGKGLYKSTNAGDAWALLPNSPIIGASSTPGVLHNPLAVDLANPNIIYYGTDHGLYVSTDGGSTWAQKTQGFAAGDTSVIDIAADPVATAVYAVLGSPGSTTADLYRSVDNGNSWTALASALDVERIVPDLVNAQTIYLSGLQFHAVYKSTDGGQTFAAADSGMPVGQGFGGVVIFSGPTGTLLPLASGDNALLATFVNAGVYHTNNAAQTWQFSSQGLSMWYGTDVAVDEKSPNNLYLATENGGLFKSPDSGSTWSKVLAGGIAGVRVDPFDSAHVIAASLSNGLNESHDGGATWHVVSLPSPQGVSTIVGMTFDPARQGVIYITASGGTIGLLRSTDGGKTYAIATAGLPSDQTTSPVAVNPLNPEMLFLGTQSGLYQSTNGGDLWTFSTAGVYGFISIDSKASPAIVYATLLGLSPAVGIRSFDLGATWETVSSPGILAADPSTAGSVFGATAWSPDAGTTWYPAFDGLGDGPYVLGGGIFNENASIVIAPTKPQTMYSPSLAVGLVKVVVGP